LLKVRHRDRDQARVFLRNELWYLEGWKSRLLGWIVGFTKG
jgi:hypothetical protein